MQTSPFIVTKAISDEQEYQRVSQWLDSQFYFSLGATVFLEQTLIHGSQWQLLRVYDSQQLHTLLGVAVLLKGGTCFWVIQDLLVASNICAAMLDYKPRRIVTNGLGRKILNDLIEGKGCILRAYDQWIMICEQRFPKSKGRLATLSDIAKLIEYQQLYNAERIVDELSDWKALIAQERIAVHEVNGEITSIVRLGIETTRLVSIGGTYTFPTFRRKGYAEKVIEYAVNRIVASGCIAHLVVDIDNKPAVELYRKMGFECVGESYVGYPQYL